MQPLNRNQMKDFQLASFILIWYISPFRFYNNGNGGGFMLFIWRSSHPEVFLGKGVLKICSKCSGENQCRSAISIRLLCNFTEIALRHGCSPVNLLHIFRTPFPRNSPGRLLLYLGRYSCKTNRFWYTSYWKFL